MMFDRGTNNGIKASRTVDGATNNQFASIQERRTMKKVARPEHAYTGCVPCTPADDETDVVPKKKNPPILGYRGHLRRDEDRIGTTFTQGLAVASRPPEPVLSRAKARASNNQPRQVRFVEDKAPQSKPTRAVKAVGMSPRSGYGQFDNACGYGNFAAPPAPGGNNDVSPRSGYGAFDNASGYGAFAAPSASANISPRSGYGAFDNASGYGAFAPPPRGGLSPRSGYGAFDNASGYGAFAPPPRGGLSPRSGYGAFDNASGYGAFAPPPRGGLSPRSGYGEFENASGYGAFAAPPEMSPRSGYGEFDNASGYGEFASPPGGGEMSPRSGYGAFDNASGYGAFAAPPGGMSARSGYDKFDDASGYVNFSSPPDSLQTATKPFPSYSRGFSEPTKANAANYQYKPIDDRRGDRVRQSNTQIQEQHSRASKAQIITDPVIHAKYRQAIHRVGGEQAAFRLWSTAGQTIWQRHIMRTELLQAVKRSFEKHERTNHGYMTKAELKEVLRDLACVFTDDQITALFGMHDKQCTGTVPMSELLLALTENL